MTERTTKDL